MNPKLVGNSYFTLCQQIESFEKMLEEHPVSVDEVEIHFNQLDVFAQKLRELTLDFPDFSSEISNRLDRVVSLYGRVITLYQEREVAIIHRETHVIEENLKTNNVIKLAKKTHSLKERLKAFCENNRPCLDGRRILSSARSSLNKAEMVLNNKKWKSPLPPLSLIEFDQPMQEALTEDLFEIGCLIYQKKIKEGKALILQLPETIKRRFFLHLLELKGDPEHFTRHRLKCEQALLAVAFEIADSTPIFHYFTSQEAEEFFLERLSRETST